MILSIIVAASENHVIGCHNTLIWHISADLKRFKQLTTGHTVLMGRKTFESIGRALPNRRNIVISRNEELQAVGCEQARSIDEALEMVKDEDEVFVIGGGAIYREVWERADRLYYTLVHANVSGDTYIPDINIEKWEMTSKEDFSAGENDDFEYSFIYYQRK